MSAIKIAFYLKCAALVQKTIECLLVQLLCFFESLFRWVAECAKTSLRDTRKIPSHTMYLRFF